MNTKDETMAMAVSETPQARFATYGPGAMSDSELLALMLGGNAGKALEMARAMVLDAGSLAGLARWGSDEYARINGIGEAAAARLAAVVEIGRRMMAGGNSAEPVLNRPELIAGYMAPKQAGLEVEKFWVLALNRKNRLIKCTEISSGTATSSLAHPREVYREAIRHGATALICVHNHPSGDPAPSAADVQVTRQLREAGRAVDIDLLDHVIIGKAQTDPTGRGFYSFREAGIL